MRFLDWLLKRFNLVLVSKDEYENAVIAYDKLRTNYILFPVVRPYTDMCLSLMRHFDSLQADGEWKAHNVYARLLKKFPKVNKNLLRLEIELCYQQHFKKIEDV